MSTNMDFRLNRLEQPIVQTYDPSLQLSSKSNQGHHFKVINSHESSHQHDSSCHCHIIPPFLSHRIHEARQQTNIQDIREHAIKNQHSDDFYRTFRKQVIAEPVVTFKWHDESKAEEKRIFKSKNLSVVTSTIYTAKNKYRLPGKFVLEKRGKAVKGSSSDSTVLTAMDNALNVFNFYLQAYKYNSIDGRNMPIVSTVHYGRNYENAFWDGRQMVYGDGSDLFDSFVKYLDIVAHELTHGVTGNRLIYEGEAGALNEHFSDVLGYLALLYTHQYKVDDPNATWTLAEGIIKDGYKSYPLRSFKAPGTAYDTEDLGKDPQMAKYQDRYLGKEDNGGVHINSGIPNHAFYLFAKALGGYPWKKAGLIWFTTLMTPDLFKPDATMAEFAAATIKIADTYFANDTQVYNGIRSAWKEVGVIL